MANAGAGGGTGTGAGGWWPEVPSPFPAPTTPVYSNPDYPGSANYKGGTTSQGTTGDTGKVGSGNGLYKNLTNKPVLWNPPTHRLTKAPKIGWSGYIGQGVDTPGTGQGLPGGVSTGSSVVDAAIKKDPLSFGRLGAIYTDDWTAAGANGLYTRRYGCVFHYNPTSVAYSVGTNDSLPTYSSGSQAGSALIADGTISLSLELYFNRIYDLAAPAAGHYERPLSKKNAVGENERTMIQTRGTEYDIEFLYRAANGDPQPGRHADYLTSDFGFIMRTPLRLRLGAFTYIVLVQGISVNHMIFTEQMVPTFTQVSLTVDRQVTLGGADSIDPNDPWGSTRAAVDDYRLNTETAP